MTKKTKETPAGPHVSSMTIHHALRASLLLNTGQSTYSSLEVGIQVHVEGIPPGADYKAIAAGFSNEVMQMVSKRVNEDANALGFQAFTDYKADEVEMGTSEETMGDL